MELNYDGHTALFTMQFSNVYPPDEISAPGPSSSLARFSEWHILLRIKSVEELMFVRSDTKVYSPTPSLTSAAARGVHPDGSPYIPLTKPDGIPIVPVSQPSPKVQATLMAYSRGEESATHIDLDVHFDTLEAGVLGLHNKVAPTSPSAKPREEPLKDVRLRCAGSRTCGWFMGAVVASVGGIPLELPQPVRFLLKRYTGRRCTHCLDPVYSIGFTCHYCEVPRYCCRECMVAHQRHGHALVCAHLKLAYGQRAGVVANEINQDIRLVAWWTSLGGSRYSVLADANAAMDIAIEYFLDTLDEGDLTYRVIYTKETSEAKLRGMPEEAVMGYSTMLLKEVFYSAVRDGFHGLASACLYQLFRHCASNPITLEVHDDFYTIFNYEDFEGPVNTVEEYVSHTRPLHCLALLHMERALRSTISNDFWKSIRDAKEVLVALFSVYMSDPCKELEEIQPVIDLQRVETLFLLSKALLIMAARTPREDCIATLETAEKCLSQALLINCVQQDDRLHAACLFRLSILQRLYNEPERILEAEDLKQKGMMLLRSSGSVTPQQSGEEMAEDRASEISDEKPTNRRQNHNNNNKGNKGGQKKGKKSKK